MIDTLKKLFPDKEVHFEYAKTVATQNNRTFRVICDPGLTSSIVRISIDGCLITCPNSKKCDFLFVDSQNNTAMFIECKGNDVKNALIQIEATIKILKAVYDKSKNRFAFIIPTRVAPAITTTLQKVQNRMMKEYGLTVLVKNRICEFKLPECKIM